jgi:hypothetical protein
MRPSKLEAIGHGAIPKRACTFVGKHAAALLRSIKAYGE